MLTAVQLVNIMKVKNKKLSELAEELETFPQQLVNIRVSDKHAVEENHAVKAVIEQVEEKMAGNGRVLVRPSGTESLVRVMVEAETDELCFEYVNEISAVVQEQLGTDA